MGFVSGNHIFLLIIFLVIVLIIFGPGKLPDIGGAMGKGIREFRKASSEVKDAVMSQDDHKDAAPVSIAKPAADAPVAAAPAPVATPAPVAVPGAAAPEPARPAGVSADRGA